MRLIRTESEDCIAQLSASVDGSTHVLSIFVSTEARQEWGLLTSYEQEFIVYSRVFMMDTNNKTV